MNKNKYWITFETSEYSHDPGFSFSNKREAVKNWNYYSKHGSFWLQDEAQKGREWNVCLWKDGEEGEAILIKERVFKIR